MEFICDLTTPGHNLNTITTAQLIKANLKQFCEMHKLVPDKISSAVYKFDPKVIQTLYTITIECKKGSGKVSAAWLKSNPLDNARLWVFDGSFGSNGADPATDQNYRMV